MNPIIAPDNRTRLEARRKIEREIRARYAALEPPSGWLRRLARRIEVERAIEAEMNRRFPPHALYGVSRFAAATEGIEAPVVAVNQPEGAYLAFNHAVVGGALAAVAVAVVGCSSATRPAPSSTASSTPSNTTRGPNWEEIDKTVQRVREAEKNRGKLVETERTVENGFFAMTDEEYASALDAAREEIKKANPKMAVADVESAATKRADEAKRRQETAFTARASSTYEWKKP